MPTATPRAGERCSSAASSPAPACCWPWLAAAAVVIFQWFGVALLVLGPLLFLGAAWAVLVVLSSAWDRNGTAPRLARHGRQDPRLRRQGRTQPDHHRRHRRARTALRRWTSRRSSRSPRRWPLPQRPPACSPPRQPPAAVRSPPPCRQRSAGARSGSAPLVRQPVRRGVRAAAGSARPSRARIPTTTTTAPRSAATRTPRSPWRCSGSGWTTAATSNWTAPC